MPGFSLYRLKTLKTIDSPKMIVFRDAHFPFSLLLPACCKQRNPRYKERLISRLVQ